MSLAQKWMFTCHLVIAGSSHHRPRVEDENAFSSGKGVLFPTVSASCRSPSPSIPPGTSTWAPVLGQSTRGRCGAPSSQHSCSRCSSGDEMRNSGKDQNCWTDCKLLPAGNFFVRTFTLKISCRACFFFIGILLLSMGKRKQRRVSHQLSVI